MRRFLGSLATLAFAFAATTCREDAAGPFRRFASVAIQPVLPPNLDLAAFSLSIDNVRLTVARQSGETILNKLYPFPAESTSLRLDEKIDLETDPEAFHVTLELLSRSQSLFSGAQDVTLVSGTGNPSTQVPVAYSGPGQNVASLSIAPFDSVVSLNGALTFRTTARDGQGVIVPDYYLAWTSSNQPLAPIDATGRIVAPNQRGVVTVEARTFNGVTAATSVTFIPAPTAVNLVSTCNLSVLPGAQLPAPIAVRVIANDNAGVKGIPVQFAAITGGGSVVPAQVVTDGQGLAQTVATVGPNPGPNLFRASIAGVATTADCNATATGVAPTQLAFRTQPASAVAGASLGTMQVELRDATGTLVTTATNAVSLGIGANPGGATLGGTPTTVNAVAGVATFTGLSLNKVGTNYTLVATSGTLTPATSTPFTISAGPVAGIAYTTPPVGVTAGTTLPPIVVTAQDNFANTVTSFIGNVTLAFGSHPPGANLRGTAALAATAGVATFSTLSIDSAGSYTLVASSPGLQSVASPTFTITAGPPAVVLKISGDNQNGAGGAALGQPLVVEVHDSVGNGVGNAPVTWATPDGGSFAPASGPTGTNGRAQTTWTLGPTAPSQTATATVGALAPVSFSATATVGTPAISLSFAGIPGVGVGLSAKVYVDLNQAAPAGGTLVTLASGDFNVFTVSPLTVTISQSKTRDSVTVQGVAPGQANLTATATSFTTGTLPVVVQNRNISVPQTLNVPYGQTASLPIQLPAPAPAGGVTFSVQSSAPGNVGVATPSVTILAGSQAANATLNGVLPGPATITVSNAAYFDGVTAATTTASLNIVQTTASLNQSFGTSITINFESNGAAAAAPAPGISVSLGATDPTCVVATSPVTIPTGLVSTTATLSYGGSASLPCTTKVLAQATNLQPDSLNVTVNPVPGITVGPVTVGSGLQDNTSFTLGAPNHGNINVTLTSADPGVLLAPNATTAGQTVITLPVLDGVQTVGFYVQAAEGRTTDTIRATVTVSAPGFSDGTATMTAQQAALDLQGVPPSTTTLSASSFVYARVGTAGAGNGSLNRLQAVRAGAPGPLTVTFTTPATGVGELLKKATPSGVTQTATIPIGLTNSPTDTTTGGVAFHPLSSGGTSVSAAIAGFIATTQATRSITVSQPGITVGAVTVGSGLQDNTSFTLGAPNHGNINVQLTSSDPGVLLAPNATTAGQAQITMPVLDGVQTVGFYVQAAEGRTTDTIRATVTIQAPGFSDGTATMTAQQAALDLQGLPTATTTLSASSFVYARVGTAGAGNGSLNRLQAVRAGAPGPLTVTFTTPVGVGELLKAAAPAGGTQTATIAIGQTNSPTDTTTGGVAFHPLSNGATTVSAAIAGFIATTQATRSITVSQPGITVGAVTVGSGLQDNTSFTLGAPNHGNINVQLTSSDPGVLLAPNATTAGQAQVTLPVADGVQTVGFYVQAAEGRTTDTIRATVTIQAPGFSDGVATMTAQQAALDLQGLPTTTTTLSPSSSVYARVGTAGAGNGSLNRLQAVRAGAPGPLTVTFTTPATGIGELLKKATPSGVTQTATIPIGLTNSPTDTTSGGVAFHGLLSGNTSVSATIPGFIATTQATRSIAVSQPGITVGAVTVGSGLQDNTSFTLGAPNHGNISVTVSSSNGVALVSPNATTPGASQITIPVADGVQTVGFYVQGLEGQTGSVTATITVNAPGFQDGTNTATVVQGALDLQGLPTATTPLSPSSFVYARVGTAAAGNGSLNRVQTVRAGAPGALTVTFTTPANGIGELLKAATPAAASQTASIPIGQSTSPTDTTTGGVAFHPLSGLGPTTVSATITGFIATTQATRSITNATPGISVGTVTVGSGLQVNTSFTLGAPNHGNFSVTISSSNAAVLVSPNATTAGASQITIPVADGVQTVGFYVQGLEGLSGSVAGDITITAAGFTDGTASETVVQAALDLLGVPATMAVGAPDANIYARLGTPSVGNGSLAQLQALRAGLPAGAITIAFTSSNVSAATLVNSAGGTGSPQTAQIAIGQSNTPTTVGSGGVGLRRVAAGTSSISVSASGIITTGQGTRSVTVQ